MDIISRWISPDPLKDQWYSVSKAKKAIGDYRKAVSDPEGIAELGVFYCEEAVEFANTYGTDDAGYCNALVNMFEQSLKSIKKVEPKRGRPLVDRLDELRHDIQFGYAYGVEESMDELLVKYGFDE